MVQLHGACTQLGEHRHQSSPETLPKKYLVKKLLIAIKLAKCNSDRRWNGAKAQQKATSQLTSNTGRQAAVWTPGDEVRCEQGESGQQGGVEGHLWHFEAVRPN